MMEQRDPLSVWSPEGAALVAGVALAYLAIRMLPRLLVGLRAYLPAEELKRRLDTGEDVLLLDVRNAAEFAAPPGHLRGAMNVPLGRLRSSLAEPGWQARPRELPIVTICASDARAAFAVRILRRAGFRNVKVLSGGMEAWSQAGFPLARPHSR